MTPELTCRYEEAWENSDEPRCPKCGGYNAMLHDGESTRVWWNRQGRNIESVQPDFRKCRDCGVQAVCKMEAEK
tara:strand:+ start:146 stop:367 length:222 start_codon:yes stop_codon:yes gene_type:complete